MGANILMLVLTFINNKLMYVFVDEDGNGLYFLVGRFALLIVLIAGEWLRLSNTNIAGRDRNLTGALISNNLWYVLTLSIFLFLGAALFYPFLARVFNIPAGLLFVAIAVASIMVIMNTSQSLLLVNQRIFHYSITQLILGFTFLGLDVVFLVVFGFGLYAVIFAWIISLLIAAVWALFANISQCGFRLLPSPAIFRESRGTGIRACVAIFGMFLMLNIHAFVLEPITRGTGCGLVTVAVFSVCSRVFQLFQRFSDVTGALLLSNVVQQDKNTGSHLTALSVRNIVLLSIVLSLVGVLLGKGLILFVSDAKYMAAYIPLMIMLPGIVAVNAGSLLNGFYWGHGYPYHISLASFAAAIIALLLDILLVPRWGVSGATFSFTAVSIVWMIYMVNSFCRESGLRFHEVLVPRYSDIKMVVSRFSGFFRRGK